MAGVELSGLEVKVLLGVAYGMSVEEVATQAAMRLKTVRVLLSSAKDKLTCRAMTDAAAVERAYVTGALPNPMPEPASRQVALRISTSQVALIWLISLGATASGISKRSHVPVIKVEQDIRALCESTGAASAAHLITRARQLNIRYHRGLPPTRSPLPPSRRPARAACTVKPRRTDDTAGTMSPEPAQPVIDTHVILRDGDKILFSQRGGPYGHGRWHVPSGKLDKGEPLTVGAVRELFAETGIHVGPGDLRLVQVVHHKQSATVERIGFFFEATAWIGEPVNREPEKCMSLEWFSVHELPDDIIEYPKEGIDGYLADAAPLSEHGWQGPA
ncbi:NUDIX domain-containing protein [Streptomyces sp. NPDC059080]|uniref:NUDIX domain-containing protein n=1 Tax=Streptomyces sp. NPDC059080 TaxID=3346718 RepID=UPI00368EC743